MARHECCKTEPLACPELPPPRKLGRRVARESGFPRDAPVARRDTGASSRPRSGKGRAPRRASGQPRLSYCLCCVAVSQCWLHHGAMPGPPVGVVLCTPTRPHPLAEGKRGFRDRAATEHPSAPRAVRAPRCCRAQTDMGPIGASSGNGARRGGAPPRAEEGRPPRGSSTSRPCTPKGVPPALLSRLLVYNEAT